ncbi:MAG: zinc-dependent alcohol dehydrogenase family protein [Candidatus Obscuribacterales bacterium]|nr:zinc-dependent alcohol dehydrogenase family protein [Candidatus Obscuribacterales bacterium]
MAKIVRFDSVGDATVLKIVDEPVPTPQADEIRLKVEAIGLNRAEVLFRQGLYLEKPILPARIGYEASGIVDAVGANVKEFKAGDRVSTIPAFPMSKYGVYGEMAIVPAFAVAKYPDNLTPEEGASIWMQYITAYGALVEFGKMKKGDFVLITAASSSVGNAAIQLCKNFGAISICTTRTSAKKNDLLKAGANHVIVTDEEDMVKRVMEITDNNGAGLIFDPVAGPLLMQLAKCAAYNATIFEYGALSLDNTPFPLMLALDKSLLVQGYTLFHINKNAEMRQRAVKYVYDNLKNGNLKPIIDRVFTFDQLIEAQKYMESNVQNGKIVVKL